MSTTTDFNLIECRINAMRPFSPRPSRVRLKVRIIAEIEETWPQAAHAILDKVFAQIMESRDGAL